MKFRQRWSERTRILLTLELAVVLPAAALVILSAQYLNHLQRERGIEAAIQRDFSQVLAISEKEINHKTFELADDVRDDFPGPGEACSETLDRILAAHPYAAHVFLYDPKHGIVFRSQPYRLKTDSNFHSEAESLSSMSEGWMSMEFKQLVEDLAKMDKKGMPYYPWYNWAPRGDKRTYQSGFLFLVKGKDLEHSAVGGMVFDADFLNNKFFPQVFKTVATQNLDSQKETNPPVMMLHAKSDSTPMVASVGWDGGTPEVERKLEGAFPGLVLAIKLRGTTIEAIGKRFVRNSFLILGGLSLLLAGGIYLNYRSVTKEMAVARLKSDFVSNVSHELRTPLSLIRLYAETLELGRLPNPEKRQEYYAIIRKESERLSALINNILDFSRIEAGRKEYDFRETDVRELVENTLESYRYQIEQNGFIFEEKLEDIPPMRVDREAMARSLLNLVNNAIKYSQDRKYLAVNLFRDNGSVKLEVIDHGIGIPVHEQQKIFEKFYRVGDPLVHNTKGSGLGLALVRHIAHAHGGEVSVDSAPGRGSRFTISLPVNAEGKNRTVSAQTTTA